MLGGLPSIVGGRRGTRPLWERAHVRFCRVRFGASDESAERLMRDVSPGQEASARRRDDEARRRGECLAVGAAVRASHDGNALLRLAIGCRFRVSFHRP